jgi:hypothetical protein
VVVVNTNRVRLIAESRRKRIVFPETGDRCVLARLGLVLELQRLAHFGKRLA